MTDKYYKFVKSNEFDHDKLTGNQAKFVEWLLDNHKMVSMIGSYQTLFNQVRKFIKNNHEHFNN